MAEKVFQVHHSFDMVQFIVGYRVHGIHVLLHFIPDRFGGFADFQPNEVTAVGHDRTDFTVAQVENFFYNVLFYFLDFTVFSTFLNDCFNFFFGHFIFGRSMKSVSRITAWVLAESNQTKGEAILDSTSMGRAINRAIFSGAFIPRCFGTSSPNIKVR